MHKLDPQGLYVIDTFIRNTSDTPTFIDGGVDYTFTQLTDDWILKNTNENLFINGERMDFIPDGLGLKYPGTIMQPHLLLGEV